MPASKQRFSVSNYTSPNKVELITGGKPFFDILLKMIADAERIIHFQTYIFDEDETGHLVADALKEASVRGVEVYLMIDGYASQSLSDEFIEGLKANKIRFKYFEPLLRSNKFYFGRRMHHKMVVVDDRLALVSGRNVSDRYNDIGNQKAWLDFAVLVEGKVVPDLVLLCWKTWNGFINTGKKYKIVTPSRELVISTEENCMVRMRRNDWVRRKNQISKSYISMLRDAEKEVNILCSYFIPGRAIRRNITRARKRGVDVNIIMAGRSDLWITKKAERFMYDWLLRRDVVIYEYQESVLHGKVAVMDDNWMTIGSYNINNISAFASVEMNLDIINEGIVSETKKKLIEIRENECLLIEKTERHFNKNPFDQFLCWMSYQLIRLLFFLFTFYYKQMPLPEKASNS